MDRHTTIELRSFIIVDYKNGKSQIEIAKKVVQRTSREVDCQTSVQTECTKTASHGRETF